MGTTHKKVYAMNPYAQVLLKRTATWEGTTIDNNKNSSALRGFSLGSYISKRTRIAGNQMHSSAEETSVPESHKHVRTAGEKR